MQKARIISTQYTLQTKSLEIYVSGCIGNPHCKGCHNPETWDFGLGEEYSPSFFLKIQRKVDCFRKVIQNIMIFGGEPLDSDCEQMLKDLHSLGLPVWLFTHYKLEEVPDYVKDYCTYIKCGRYLEDYKTDDNVQFGVQLATSNQMIYNKGADY
jgi:anaerobic ribonucleoside-triphosphate reductase activating protein